MRGRTGTSQVGSRQRRRFLRVHLIPRLGRKTLDAITNEDIQRLKLRLREKAPKTTNNVLATLRRMLAVAVEWGVIDTMPCTIRQVKTVRPVMAFHDFDAYAQLVAAARAVDSNSYLIVLLGGEAGLRCGEMMALEWSDVDLGKRQLRIRQSEWKGHVTSTKGGRLRYVPMTLRLAAALRDHRHLRSPRVLVDEGRTLSQKMVQDRVRWASRKAGLERQGVHILRHTFCSHLAMRGAPARAIQELAGSRRLVHDAAVHASESCGDRGCDSAPGRRWRGRDRGDGAPKMRMPLSLLGQNGGGGGSRTRVRRHGSVGLYMRVRSLYLTTGVEEWQKPPAASPEKSYHRVSVRRALASPLNGV